MYRLNRQFCSHRNVVLETSDEDTYEDDLMKIFRCAAFFPTLWGLEFFESPLNKSHLGHFCQFNILCMQTKKFARFARIFYLPLIIFDHMLLLLKEIVLHIFKVLISMT